MPSRRAQGEGSIYYVEKLKRWYANISVSVIGGRKRIVRSFRTKQEASAGLEGLRAQQKSGYFDLDTETVLDQVNALFDEKKRTKSWRPSSLRLKELQLRKWLTPALGTLLLRDFKPKVARQILTKLEEKAGRSTILSCHSLLYSACELAVAEELIPTNPCRAWTPAPAEETKKVLWSQEEHQRFDLAILGLPEYAFFVTLRETGLRIGEVQALRWKNVSFEEHYLYVEHTLSPVGENVLGPPKTRKSERIRHIDSDLVEILRNHKCVQAQSLAKQGFQVDGDTFVFTNKDAGYFSREKLRRKLNEICKRAGVTRITFHTFRHMAASALKKAGVDSLVIAEELGHTNKSITEDFYIQNDNQQRRLAALSSRQLFGLESNKNAS
jgi:integrase